MLESIQATRNAAIALLTPNANMTVEGDAAELAGDTVAAEIARDQPAYSGESHRSLAIGAEFVPGTLHAFTPQRILAFFFADDGRTTCDRYGVKAGAAAESVLGDDNPDWIEVLDAAYSKQQALVMLVLAAIREARAMAKVRRSIEARGFTPAATVGG